jgi:xylose isomerase
MDLGAELGAKVFVLWAGRDGPETDGCRWADVAVQRTRDAINYLCEFNADKKYGFKFALEPSPMNPEAIFISRL